MAKTDTPPALKNEWRRFECPATRDGMKLLWKKGKTMTDETGATVQYERVVRFMAAFYATDDPDELECLEWLADKAQRAQVVEVPYETSRPTKTRTGEPQPRVPGDFARD